jgi:hypothetical protein
MIGNSENKIWAGADMAFFMLVSQRLISKIEYDDEADDLRTIKEV